MIEIDFTKRLQGAGAPLQLQVQARIDNGCFVTLFGPSGAGKTSILRMLAGLADPDGGSLKIDGTTWFDAQRRINLPPQKRAIGYVFQDYALFPNLTVRQNIAYAVDLRTPGAEDWIDELVDMMALGALQHRLPGMLSGGQKQRVALARAVARKPALLLLDEPLSALDLELRQRLQDDLLDLHRRLGLTTLLVSHDIGEVFKLSQHVLRLEQGRVVQSGSPAEVFLARSLSGRVNMHAQVLGVRREEVVHIVSLLIGQDIIDVIASDEEAAGLHVGEFVTVSAKAFSPFLFKKNGSQARAEK